MRRSAADKARKFFLLKTATSSSPQSAMRFLTSLNSPSPSSSSNSMSSSLTLGTINPKMKNGREKIENRHMRCWAAVEGGWDTIPRTNSGRDRANIAIGLSLYSNLSKVSTPDLGRGTTIHGDPNNTSAEHGLLIDTRGEQTTEPPIETVRSEQIRLNPDSRNCILSGDTIPRTNSGRDRANNATGLSLYSNLSKVSTLDLGRGTTIRRDPNSTSAEDDRILLIRSTNSKRSCRAKLSEAKKVSTHVHRVSTPEDLGAALIKSSRSLKQMKEIMNLNVLNILKIIHIHGEDISKIVK
ncbi:hypothetical protein Acr_11g0015600 [Actinidia rufa]|uniref:Uncharacterized protein n=1 Tax=Actinidia rufa TaxID=165716 RepID=A0A7J0FEX5_9ERIC|nr:hypothetical protein Acr_11g0015600 [Actinidia rufa]